MTRALKSAHYEIPDDALLLIISQTCDLIQGSFESEPYFEVLCIRSLDRDPRGDYLGGKNSRRIEFSLDLEGNGATKWFAFPFERHPIKRELLLNLNTDYFIQDKSTLKMILRWLSRRYTRTAFPETFVSRVEKRKSQISKKFSRLNPHVSNVYIRVTPFGELYDDDEYSIELILVMNAQNFDDAALYQSCDSIKKELEHQLGQCAGIHVDDINIESTASLTIEDLKGFLEWDYSYLSFRDPDNSSSPVEI
jgi:hypothetical protein